jgi:hypothetical protein
LGVVERGDCDLALATVYKLAQRLDASVSALLKGIL